MTLIACVECKAPISNEARACPHCGYMPRRPQKDRAEHLRGLRRNSAYPTFRALVRFFTWVGYLGAAFMVIVAFLVPMDGASGGMGAKLMGFGVAVAIVIFTRIGSEMALMLADIGDASIQSSAAD